MSNDPLIKSSLDIISFKRGILVSTPSITYSFSALFNLTMHSCLVFPVEISLEINPS